MSFVLLQETLMEHTNTDGQRSGTGNMPQDRRKEEEATKKTGQQSQGGSSQDWQRDESASERGASSGSADEHDRMKNSDVQAARSGPASPDNPRGQTSRTAPPNSLKGLRNGYRGAVSSRYRCVFQACVPYPTFAQSRNSGSHIV
jgi:general stress protein YciG